MNESIRLFSEAPSQTNSIGLNLGSEGPKCHTSY